MTPTSDAPVTDAKAVRLDVNEHELLGRFSRAGKPVSLAQLNDGLEPNWQVAALANLIALGCLDANGFTREGRASQWMLAVTARGRASLKLRPVPAEPEPTNPWARAWKSRRDRQAGQ